ncbi:bifunctional 4-hydroxy-2-oxoglutarate aldolase/2-dehydro-3-deoxy-phosphogluconate aldolase [Microbacterium resistens]|uniref:bifunctional 4-hydroxy-2-oxoglutarate aldolase/2-dehydro-3-deoxy-phosphogluconate aldolase n=1 Tax=Microbacterium resistens TaxID=156977 RepID=UPI001C5624D9|nr:bifunctional 4-hydroxy-2-oxoglutarate aldolase/2-dehydro-3-deoxy-phosphogluconate aldolase [Microbacterium resistens]MBW1638468.1 bifunctional 4-hydroxy-2-oxoglutarate aldolase/2-dehydro-3-deoxy-phosphogluconate aldolase [Microbacterium resistens]
MSRQAIAGSQLQRTGVVAVLRATNFADYGRVVDTLVDSGVTCVELTLTTPRTIEEFDTLRSQLPDNVELGIGTVTSVEQANLAIDAGAQFLVTPVNRLGVVKAAVKREVPIFPGSMTPTEVFDSWEAGATAVKLFPAATLKPDFIRQLRGPFPTLDALPSGGVALDDIGAWIRAGAVAVSLGGPLIGDAFTGGDLGALRARAGEALSRVAEARAA